MSTVADSTTCGYERRIFLWNPLGLHTPRIPHIQTPLPSETSKRAAHLHPLTSSLQLRLVALPNFLPYGIEVLFIDENTVAILIRPGTTTKSAFRFHTTDHLGIFHIQFST